MAEQQYPHSGDKPVVPPTIFIQDESLNEVKASQSSLHKAVDEFSAVSGNQTEFSQEQRPKTSPANLTSNSMDRAPSGGKSGMLQPQSSLSSQLKPDRSSRSLAATSILPPRSVSKLSSIADFFEKTGSKLPNSGSTGTDVFAKNRSITSASQSSSKSDVFGSERKTSISGVRSSITGGRAESFMDTETAIFTLNDKEGGTTKLTGYSLGLFSPENRFRMFLHRLISRKWYQPVITLLTFINWIIYASMSFQKRQKRQDEFGFMWQDYALLAVFIMYTLEIIAKCIVYGFFIRGNYTLVDKIEYYLLKYLYNSDVEPLDYFEANHTFWKSAGNQFDFAICMFFWIYVAISQTGSVWVLVFRTLSAMRPFRLLLLVSRGLSVITRSVTSSSKLLGKVLVFITYIYLFLAITGVQFHKGTLARRCVLESTDGNGLVSNQMVKPIKACGSYEMQDGSIMTAKYHQGVPQGYACPYPQVCKYMETANEKPFGFVSFDNIFSATFSIFQSATEQGWTRTMYMSMDAQDWSSFIYHVVVILLVDFILMNMLVAVISETYSSIRSQYQEALVKERKRKQILQQTANGWKLTKEGNKFDTRSVLYEYAKFITTSQWYKYVVVAASLLSLSTVLMDQKYVNDEGMLQLTYSLDLMLLVFFTADVLIQFNALENGEKFYHGKQRLFDTFLVIGNALIDIPQVRRSPVAKYLSLFQILRFQRLAEAFPRLQKTLKLAFGDLQSFFSVILFVIMILSTFATMAMQLFGGHMEFLDPNSPDSNFDSFFEAFLTTFQCMVSDNWTDPLYSGLFSQQGNTVGFFFSGIFFTCLFIMCHSVVVDLAVAVLLENFEFQEEEKKFGQVIQLLNKIDGASQQDQSSYFSKWNPFTYLRPSPRILSVKQLPQQFRAKIRAVYHNEFVKGYSDDSSKLWKDNGDDESDYVGPWKLFKRALREKMFGKDSAAVNDSKDPSSAQQDQDDQGAVESTILDDGSYVRNKVLAIVSELRHRGGSKTLHHAKNLDQLNPAFDEAQVRVQTDQGSERREAVSRFNEAHPLYDASYFLFTPDHWFRRLCIFLVGKNGTSRRKMSIAIENIFIILSCLALTFDSPASRRRSLESFLVSYATSQNTTVSQIDLINPVPEVRMLIESKEFYREWVYLSNDVFAVIFALFFLFRSVADGLLISPQPFLLNGWSWIDVITLFTSWYSILTPVSSNVGFPRIVRALRGLKAFRIIPQFDGMKRIFETVCSSFLNIMEAILLFLFFLVPYASYGNVLFAGLMNSCNDHSMLTANECTGIYLDQSLGYYIPRQWAAQQITTTFDDFWSSLLSLFEMVLEEGWMLKFYAGISNNGVVGGESKWPPLSPWNAFYFLIWMIFGYVIMRNLFVGVIMQAFMTRDGTALLTNQQRNWVEVQKSMKLLRPSRKRELVSNSKWRGICFNLVKDKNGPLSKLVFWTTIVTTIVMMSNFQQYVTLANGDLSPDYSLVAYDGFQRYFYGCVSIVYMFDFVVKRYGLGFKKWRQNPWHWYDLFVAQGLFNISVLRMAKVDLVLQQTEAFVQIQNAFLDMTFVKLIPLVPVLKTFDKTITASAKQISNVLGVLLVTLTAYTLICMELFGLTRHGTTTDSHANFRQFGVGMLTLFRMTTGEVWNGIVKDMRVEYPECEANPFTYLLSDCGGNSYALLIFISFEIVMTLIFTGLFVVTVVDSFDAAQEEGSEVTVLTAEDLALFKQNWAEFDPKGKGFIRVDQIPRFLSKLQGRLRVEVYSKEFQVHQLMGSCRYVPAKKQGDTKFGSQTLKTAIVKSESTEKPKLRSRILSANIVKSLTKTASAGADQELSKTASGGGLKRMNTDNAILEAANDKPNPLKPKILVSSMIDVTGDDVGGYGSLSRGQNKGDSANKLRKSTILSVSSDQQKQKSVYDTMVKKMVNITLLNQTLSGLKNEQVRTRRAKLNFVYHEALLADDGVNGISFQKMLHILSMQLIDPEKALKIEELFQRQQEIEMIHEQVCKEKLRSIFVGIAIQRRYERMREQRDMMTSGDRPVSAGDIPPVPSIDRSKFPFARETSNLSSGRNSAKAPERPDSRMNEFGQADDGIKFGSPQQIPTIVVVDEMSNATIPRRGDFNAPIEKADASAVSMIQDSLNLSTASSGNMKNSPSKVSWREAGTGPSALNSFQSIPESVAAHHELTEAQCKVLMDNLRKSSWLRK
ncbi:hypothetical protein MIR68_008556 [Amoeboaphelidium protococcarum]|nr:hypothetical protein MIR68_008556 [Amoeboaphelidium protococcarum]